MLSHNDNEKPAINTASRSYFRIKTQRKNDLTHNLQSVMGFFWHYVNYYYLRPNHRERKFYIIMTSWGNEIAY